MKKKTKITIAVILLMIIVLAVIFGIKSKKKDTNESGEIGRASCRERV